MKQLQPILIEIAREHLLIPTLEPRRSDILDFHDVAVWQVEAALNAAFDAGVRFGRTNAERQGEPRDEPILAALLPTPLLVPKGTPLARQDVPSAVSRPYRSRSGNGRVGL